MKDKQAVHRIQKKVIHGHLKAATHIQKHNMKQSPATPTLLFMPSYEIYGHVLLILELDKKAKEMFEMAIMERMGRVQSIVGLARSHAMLGNVKEANYFYNFLQIQLKDADDTNPFIQEAKSWFKSEGNPLKLREQWHWPYL